jgi:hypothetical protein
MAALLGYAGERHAPPDGQLLRYRNGRRITHRRYAQAGTARAPWPVTTIVSCLPVLVLAMGTTLAHILRADAGPATG